MATAFVAALFVPVVFGMSAQASESADGDKQPDVRLTPLRLETPGAYDGNKTMWVWHKGKRGYVLDVGSSTVATGFKELLIYDLESDTRLLDTVPLDPAGYAYAAATEAFSAGGDRTMAVDQEGGRLILATHYVVGAAETPRATGRGTVCTTAEPSPRCFGGISVLDAETGQLIRHVPLRLTADAPVSSPQLIAMRYQPSGEVAGGKVLALVQDWVHGSPFLSKTPWASPRQIFGQVTYLVQFDPDAGIQEWAVRLEACRGAPYGTSAGAVNNVYGLQHAAALFASPHMGDRAVYVGCHGNNESLTAVAVRVALDAKGNPQVPVALDLPAGATPQQPSNGTLPSAESRTGEMQEPITAVEGPDKIHEILADPVTGRILFQVLDGRPLAQVWWVYDSRQRQFVGTIGIGGPVKVGTSLSAVSEATGRLYVMAGPSKEGGRTMQAGLYVADIRHTPVSQALFYPEFGRLGIEEMIYAYRLNLIVQELDGGGTRIWFPDSQVRLAYLAVEDHRPVDALPPPDNFTGRTFDLDELPGVTSAQADGTARGYGFRAVLIAGAEGATRVGPVDPVGTVGQCNDAVWSTTGDAVPWNTAWQRLTAIKHGEPTSSRTAEAPCTILGVPYSESCQTADREIVLASVGPQGAAIVDGSGSRGTVQPYLVDSGTIADSSNPVSRCSSLNWEQVWSTALFGRAPVSEPSAGDGFAPSLAQCVSTSEVPEQRVGDAVTRGYAAEVRCQQEEASGYSYARGGSVEGVGVAEALSSFRIYRDSGRGIVARVESVARGLALDGVVTIDMVRGVAESWANGRQQSVDSANREPGYDPNCDVERSAGTCFRRHLFGVRSPGWSCGPCGDEGAFIRAMNTVFKPYASVRLREPDARMRQGAENGFIAAIQKPETERFADLVLNGDLLQTVLPTLEFIRYAPPNRQFSRMGARGRQIYQFAGVEVSSSYGIACLLVYDETSNTCAAAQEDPGSITVSLTDADGKALAGGAFEVRQDADADGVVGLKDALLPNGACVTTDDGVGTCTFDALQPGSYLVSQVAAPPGYGKVADPYVVELASGEARTVTFQNTSNVSTIVVSVADEASAPLSGAQFAVYPDPDSDGKVAADAQPAATCTTDASGSCSMQVPAGSYVLVQTSAPGGLEPIEPVAFTFASGGQTAAVGIVNYPAGGVPAVEPAASPTYTDPPAPVITESVVDYQPSDTVVADEPRASVPEAVGGTIVRVIQAPGDALRLLSRDPKQAVAWAASLLLFALAAVVVRRRVRMITVF